jgi:CheY-like chemotaxis protein
MAPGTTSQSIAPKSILVVDDEPSVVESLRLLLRIKRHQVEVAEDGEQALAMYAKGKYDLVITDCAMPEMNGVELARLIRERVPEQPILMITAYKETVTRYEKWQSCIDGMVAKPFSLEELQEALAKIFPDG